jgi:hypothetical protein
MSACLLLSSLLSTRGFLPPLQPRPHALSGRVVTFGMRAAPVPPRATLLASAQPDEPSPPRTGAGGASVILEGQTISAGSDVLCMDEHGTWWMASVIDVRSAAGDEDIFVHYKGCDPAWDEWLAAGSGRVSPQPAPPPGGADQETWRDVGEGLDPVNDKELLAKLRAERQAVVEQWMYNTLCTAHEGTWAGLVTSYSVRGDDASRLRLEERETFGVRAMVRSDGDVASTRSITFSETAEDAGADGSEPHSRRQPCSLIATDLRAEFGNMAVGGAYTLRHEALSASASTPAMLEDAPLLIEIAIAHDAGSAAREGRPAPMPGAAAGRMRVRCLLCYSPFERRGGGGPAPLARRIEWVEVVREVCAPPGTELAAPGAGRPQWADALGGDAGTGLYDPEAQRGGSGLYSLYCAGGLTVVLPTELRAGTPAAISVDWDAREMRYQADRKSDGAHDGSLLTLELTEAQGSDGDAQGD